MIFKGAGENWRSNWGCHPKLVYRQNHDQSPLRKSWSLRLPRWKRSRNRHHQPPRSRRLIGSAKNRPLLIARSLSRPPTQKSSRAENGGIREGATAAGAADARREPALQKPAKRKSPWGRPLPLRPARTKSRPQSARAVAAEDADDPA